MLSPVNLILWKQHSQWPPGKRWWHYVYLCQTQFIVRVSSSWNGMVCVCCDLSCLFGVLSYIMRRGTMSLLMWKSSCVLRFMEPVLCTADWCRVTQRSARPMGRQDSLEIRGWPVTERFLVRSTAPMGKCVPPGGWKVIDFTSTVPTISAIVWPLTSLVKYTPVGHQVCGTRRRMPKDKMSPCVHCQ